MCIECKCIKKRTGRWEKNPTVFSMDCKKSKPSYGDLNSKCYVKKILRADASSQKFWGKSLLQEVMKGHEDFFPHDYYCLLIYF